MMAVNKPTAQTHASRVRLNLFSSPSTKRVALHIQGVRDEVEGGLVPDAGMVRQAELKQQHAANMHYFLPYVSVSVRIVDLDACAWFQTGLPCGVADDVLEADPDPGVPLAWWHGRYPSRRRAEATPGRGRSPR